MVKLRNWYDVFSIKQSVNTASACSETFVEQCQMLPAGVILSNACDILRCKQFAHRKLDNLLLMMCRLYHGKGSICTEVHSVSDTSMAVFAPGDPTMLYCTTVQGVKLRSLRALPECADFCQAVDQCNLHAGTATGIGAVAVRSPVYLLTCTNMCRSSKQVRHSCSNVGRPCSKVRLGMLCHQRYDAV